jgi:hypothetical protein
MIWYALQKTLPLFVTCSLPIKQGHVFVCRYELSRVGIATSPNPSQARVLVENTVLQDVYDLE